MSPDINQTDSSSTISAMRRDDPTSWNFANTWVGWNLRQRRGRTTCGAFVAPRSADRPWRSGANV